MGDMREHFDALKEYNKERRKGNWGAFLILKPAIMGLGLTERNLYHYTFTIGKEQGQYWPSSSKWQLGRKTFNGTPESFINWFKKRQAHK